MLAEPESIQTAKQSDLHISDRLSLWTSYSTIHKFKLPFLIRVGEQNTSKVPYDEKHLRNINKKGKCKALAAHMGENYLNRYLHGSINQYLFQAFLQSWQYFHIWTFTFVNETTVLSPSIVITAEHNMMHLEHTPESEITLHIYLEDHFIQGHSKLLTVLQNLLYL